MMDSLRTAILMSLLLLVSGCVSSQKVSLPGTATREAVLETFTPPAISAAPATSTAQPRAGSINYGPEAGDFPAGVNALTALRVSDRSLLNLPAMLVSISNMPVTARPQAGPGFASWVFELYIGEGATRFMNVFYGEFPRIVPNVHGSCDLQEEIERPNGAWLGNRAWLDENQNGIQDDWEMGVGGVCVNLRDPNGQLLQTVSTDSNGYYSFDAPPGGAYRIEFILPNAFRFTPPNLGDEDHDSDADPVTGLTPILQFTGTDSAWDAGFILSEDVPIPTPSIVPPNWFIPDEPYVGPIRSGRLTYNQIGRLFPNSCLVYASAAWDIGERLDACKIVYGVDKTTPNSALLTVNEMRELAEENLNPKQPVNYSGNLFSETLPEGGQPAESLRVFYHSYTQSGWEYDPVSQSYLRYTDQADGNGKLLPAIDRLTGRQMAFENVVVLFAEHERFRHNQFEIDLGLGQKGIAYLFRDGQAFRVQWSTLNRDWERTTGLMRPIHFVDAQNNPIALHPGQTWIHLVTPFSAVMNQGTGKWLIQFVQPEDPLDTPVP